MDLSSFVGGGKPPEKEQKSVEYMAQAASPLVSGEVKLIISDKALTVTALFDTVEVAFAEINALKLADYVVTVKADSGNYAFSRMGNWCQPFYDALCDAYNKAVLRSLFVSGKPIVTAKGEYRYTENGAVGSGNAPIHIYENSVVTLPPDLGARRVPLCFVNSMDKGDYTLTLTLATGERYTYAKLGYDTAPVEAAIEKQIRVLWEKALTTAKEIDPALTTEQASRLAKLMPQGAAAPIEQFAGIAPSFAAALESKIAATRATDSYKTFKELCNPAQVWVGFRKNEVDKGTGGIDNVLAGGLGGIPCGLASGENPLAILTGNNADGETEEAAPDPYLLWLIAPSPNGQLAAVEFAEADSATFVYRTGGDFYAFARQLNRALEAINFKREVIRLSDEELRKPDNADYYMASKRTVALQFIRANFAGRIIHSSAESWKKHLLEYFGERNKEKPITETTQGNICPSCGHINDIKMRFCGGCGAKL